MENNLYIFSGLISWLKRKGYSVDKTPEWQVIGKDLTREELSRYVVFTEEAAIYTDKNNHTWKGYVYKKYFSFGKDKPRMHLYDCSTLINYGRGEYVFTNSDTIICYDTSNNNKECQVRNPKMCRHCIRVRESIGWETYKDAEDFIKKVYLNVIIVTALSSILPFVLSNLIDENFISFVLLCIVSIVSTLFIEFYVGCTLKERQFVISKVKTIIKKKYDKNK